MSTTLHEFAAACGVRVRRDQCGDPIMAGKYGQVYQYGAGRLAVMFLSDSGRRWGAVRRKLGAAGFRLLQVGDTEGSGTFDPANRVQAQLALRVIGAKRIRRISPVQRAQLEAARQQSPVARRDAAPWAGGRLEADSESARQGGALYASSQTDG